MKLKIKYLVTPEEFQKKLGLTREQAIAKANVLAIQQAKDRLEYELAEKAHNRRLAMERKSQYERFHSQFNTIAAQWPS